MIAPQEPQEVTLPKDLHSKGEQEGALKPHGLGQQDSRDISQQESAGAEGIQDSISSERQGSTLMSQEEGPKEAEELMQSEDTNPAGVQILSTSEEELQAREEESDSRKEEAPLTVNSSRHIQELQSEPAEMDQKLEDSLQVPPKPTGNCRMIDIPEKVNKKLPKEFSYVAFYCDSNSARNTDLKLWKGFFPKDLLTDSSKSFKDGDRIKIEIEGQVGDSDEDFQGEEEEDYLGPIQAIFRSDTFKSPITGHWGDDIVSSEDDEESEEEEPESERVYEVKISNPTNSEKFYLQWLK